MAKPSDVPYLATDANYTNGPDAGTATRVKPAAGELAEGFINGLANAPDAQAFNWVMGLLCDWVEHYSETASDLRFWPFYLEDPLTGGTFDASGEASSIEGLTVSEDGTKLYVLSATDSALYQYTLSTPWDISSALYDSKSLDVSGNVTSEGDVRFKNDGTVLYVLDTSDTRLEAYTLSTAWDISTASHSYAGTSFNPQDAAPQTFWIRDDGLKLYMSGSGSTRTYQYTLGTAWDVSTLSYDSKSVDLSPANYNHGICFNEDGTKAIVTTDFDAYVTRYSLSTAWDISTATIDSVTFDPPGTPNGPTKIWASRDGARLYLIDSGAEVVRQYYINRAYKL